MIKTIVCYNVSYIEQGRVKLISESSSNRVVESQAVNSGLRERNALWWLWYSWLMSATRRSKQRLNHLPNTDMAACNRNHVCTNTHSLHTGQRTMQTMPPHITHIFVTNDCLIIDDEFVDEQLPRDTTSNWRPCQDDSWKMNGQV